MSSLRKIVLALCSSLVLFGCQGAAEHREAVQDRDGEQMTVGTVQREIRVGMSGAEVAQVLGSPNIVTTDGQRREVWVYDKISTTSAYSGSYGGVSALILAGGPIGDGLIAGGGSSGYNSSAGAASTTQKTLTVIVKFDEQRTVRDFAYHTSRF